MELTKKSIGQWAEIAWNDAPTEVGIVIRTKNKEAQVLLVTTRRSGRKVSFIDWIPQSQVVALLGKMPDWPEPSFPRKYRLKK